MKMRKVMMATVVAISCVVSAFANEPVNSKLTVLQQKAGIFKVIYEGSKVGKVMMRISDDQGNQLFSQTIKSIGGFIRPVNFEGMAPGTYTIEITDARGTLSEVVTLGTPKKPVHNAFITKTAEDGKYLVSVSKRNTEQITVRIFDAENNIVHHEVIAVKGSFGIIYNLKSVPGTPLFEITDEEGNNLIAQ